MTCNKTLFHELELKECGVVTFGDGSTKKVLGLGKIKILRLPCLNDVLFVDGIVANLISITHLCDSVHSVNFNKDGCTILDKSGQVVLQGIRLLDNCYCLDIDMNKCNLTNHE
ncbi:hypothetical protein ACOSQ2_031504 [Xanthoceras sorbifolium]